MNYALSPWIILNTAFIFEHFLLHSDWDLFKKNPEKNLDISGSIHSKNNCLCDIILDNVEPVH